MVILVKLIAMVIAAFGLAIFAAPQFSQKVFEFIQKGNRLYYAGVGRGVVGLVLLLTASKSPVPTGAVALGVMLLVSGIAVFAADIEKLKAFVEGVSQMPGLVVRLMGLIAASFGILIFSIF